MCREEFLKKNKNEEEALAKRKVIGTDYTYKHEIVWRNVLVFVILHIFALFGLIKLVTGELKYVTVLWFFFMYIAIGESVTSGAHRYFTHKSYKAHAILRAYYIIFFTMAGQNSVFIWARDHRLHHRYSDTDGDPHNSNRGFFFSHMGWLMTKKHPYVIELGRKIDMSDLLADGMVMWQYRYFNELFFLLGVCFPVYVPVYFGESWMNAILFCGFCRYLTGLHITWLINSAAHLYGTRPYDKNLKPVEGWIVACVSLGEGWHNYHHAFPWDYQASELGMHFNISAVFIRLCQRVGLAWDLKTATPEMVEKRVIRTGDRTHRIFGSDEGRAAVTALGPVHPLNLTRESVLTPPDATLTVQGLPLLHENDLLSTYLIKSRSLYCGCLLFVPLLLTTPIYIPLTEEPQRLHHGTRRAP